MQELFTAQKHTYNLFVALTDHKFYQIPTVVIQACDAACKGRAWPWQWLFDIGSFELSTQICIFFTHIA